ncbi:MAG TPA: Gfo/Idh/MocA family oxidoreductase [Rhodothermales bacterium]|nr:Gfo/Idh/MocA family oxidoreductase [Rhodothermales bacterium]
MSEHKQEQEGTGKMTRRSFVGNVAMAAASVSVLPRHILGGPGFLAPSDKVNVAAIGIGGMGSSNMSRLTSQNIVAICDVDFGYVHDNAIYGDNGQVRRGRQELKEAYEKAKRYDDFRVMLDKQKDIEAVLVATPDNVHAVAAKRAMEAGKHVYVQKPLTYTVREARTLAEVAAQNPKLVTQMGNQGHSSDDGRRVIELIRGGAIGPVHEVHVWTNRPVWPQGVPRPAAVAPPSTMHWDLWKGPSTSDWGYNPIYAAFNWRGWVPFGVGAIGDMGAHLMDFPFWALDPGLPTRIETRHSMWGGDENAWDGKPPAELGSYPLATVTHYEFRNPGKQSLNLTWYDGGLMPPTPHDLPADKEMAAEGGVLYVGTKGKLIHQTYGANPFIFPDDVSAAAESIPQSIPRIQGGRDQHEMNWIRAIQGQEEISSPFSYAARLTETMVLGIAALRAEQPIEYDGANMKITNAPEANQYLDREYRAGWELLV